MGTRRKVLWTTPALGDLAEMREWISRDNPAAAQSLAKKIRSAVDHVKLHPDLGRIVPELSVANYREVIVPPYRIIYSLQGSTVIILRIWHGKRNLRTGTVRKSALDVLLSFRQGIRCDASIRGISFPGGLFHVI